MCCLVAASCSYDKLTRKLSCQSIIGLAALWMVGDSSARGSWVPSGTRPLAGLLPAVSLQSAVKVSPARSCSLALGLTRLALQSRGGLPTVGSWWPCLALTLQLTYPVSPSTSDKYIPVSVCMYACMYVCMCRRLPRQLTMMAGGWLFRG
ncbi:hypothetical protein CCMA1212_002585 [Trichoderma ghanense]|uniref:Secreted protein n=1 Tax=Trichoderma ghanense TaxID=65468 RepID=A0ABY2HEA8_9HYPO